LEKLYNLREGFTRKDDTLPPRLLSEAPADGPSQGWVVQLEPMLKEYYRGRGWDENGVPTPKKLQELGLANLG
jgi:aldehyde:ferredoxin oxidoreductase